MWKTMDEATLKSKKVADLREIAKTFGLEGYAKMKKAELVRALMKDPVFGSSSPWGSTWPPISSIPDISCPSRPRK